MIIIDIGKEKPAIVIEPIQNPIPNKEQPAPKPEPVKVPEKEPVKV